MIDSRQATSGADTIEINREVSQKLYSTEAQATRMTLDGRLKHAKGIDGQGP